MMYSRHRWVQGLLFFAAFVVITTLAGVPLDVYSEHVSRSYGISVQGWGSWIGDQAKALGLGVLFGAPILLLFNWIVRRWPRRYWLGLWVATLPLLVLVIFVSATAGADLRQVRAAQQESSGAGGRARKGGGADRNEHSARTGCF